MNKFLLTISLLILLIGCTANNDEIENIVVDVTSSEVNVHNGLEVVFSALVQSENVKKATFYFDGKEIGSVINEPYTTKYTFEDIKPGTHKVTCIVESNNGNDFSGESSVNLSLRIGDNYQGGVIFQLNNDGVSGLICSSKDLSYSDTQGENYGFSWGMEGENVATDTSNGDSNTSKMASSSNYTSQAAYHFKDGYNYNGYSDWYIPSLNELELVKDNMALIGGFEKSSVYWENMYWSSSQQNETNAFCLHFYALAGNYDAKHYSKKVRPIRKF